MFRYSWSIIGQRPLNPWLSRVLLGSVMLVCAHAAALAQESPRAQPTWWFGGSGAANFDFFSGTTQKLNAAVTTRDPFHKGDGVGFNASLLLEYRPDPVWGGIFQVGYDDRAGSFKDIVSPCTDCPASLSTAISYITIEPALRIAPFSSAFYLFAGPVVGYNIGKEFTYTQRGNPGFRDEKYSFSDMRTVVVSGRAGVGVDIPLSSAHAATQVNLSPFVSFSPDFQGPRSVESWRVDVLRAGASLKFGSGRTISRAAIPPPVVAEPDVQFSVRAPKAVVPQRRVRETFPLRNYVFFDEGSSQVPSRYTALTKDQATAFREEQLQEVQPENLTGRSQRQLALYHNILNILGDRLRRNPGTSVTLTGASQAGPAEGQALAESIRAYLVAAFGIDGSRVAVEGRDKPRVPSEQRGGALELGLLRAEDRRVDIESRSPELLLQVGGPYGALKPAQVLVVHEDPLDSYVLVHVTGAREALASWSLEVSDEQGAIQRFGPFTGDQESISGKSILGDRAKADYKFVMLGQTNSGHSVRKETSLQLVRRDDVKEEALRFGILFEFDKSLTVAKYSTFLNDMVAPLILDGGTVIIHGHTDIIGEQEYNQTLSRERAAEAQSILERAVSNAGKRGVTFEAYGFGEDSHFASFDNNLPEERCYNRTVIIDVVPAN